MIQNSYAMGIYLCYTHPMLVCFTGGGTLGHIYPALAVHDLLKHVEGYEAFWIGRKDSREQKIVEEAGIPYYPIQSGKLRRYRSFSNITDIFRLIGAFFQALTLLHRKKPAVLFSKGGFVSVPPVFAAKVLGIRIITHESDTTPGLATRLASRCALHICIPFAGSGGSLPKKKLVVTGNPIREELFAERDLSSFGIAGGMPLLLILGGSQGSLEINTLVRENLKSLCSVSYVIHQCGPSDYQDIAWENYHPVPFLGPELGSLYRQSTLVVSRGGAGTIAELMAFGCASLIIPLSEEASRGDQVENARFLVEQGSAQALFPPVGGDRFVLEVQQLLENPEKRGILSTNARKLRTEGSAQKIASLILQGE